MQRNYNSIPIQIRHNTVDKLQIIYTMQFAKKDEKQIKE